MDWENIRLMVSAQGKVCVDSYMSRLIIDDFLMKIIPICIRVCSYGFNTYVLFEAACSICLAINAVMALKQLCSCHLSHVVAFK